MKRKRKFKQTEIGIIPDDWEVKEVGDFVDIKHGYAFKGKYFTEEPNNNVVLTPGNFNIGGGFKDDKFRYTTEKYPLSYVLHERDIIVTMTDLSKNGDTLGYAARVPKSQDKKYLHNQRLGLLQFESSEINKDFLYWVLRTKTYNRFVVVSASGSTVKHTSPSRVRQYKFSVPHPTEQLAIAKILSDLDEKIEVNRQMNKTLEEIAQAIFKLWFIDFEFPNEEGKPYKSSGGEMVDSALGEVPKGWFWDKLGNVITINEKSITKDNHQESIQYVDISSVSVGKLQNRTTYALGDAPSRAKRLVSHGDTIWSCVRPNRKSYLFIYKPPQDLVVSTGFAVLSPRKIGPSYLYSSVTTEEFTDYLTSNADGSAYPAVRPEHFANADILMPSEPVMIAFENTVTPIRSKIAENERECRTLAEIRDALLPKLMTGQIRVKVPESAVKQTIKARV